MIVFAVVSALVSGDPSALKSAMAFHSSRGVFVYISMMASPAFFAMAATSSMTMDVSPASKRPNVELSAFMVPAVAGARRRGEAKLRVPVAAAAARTTKLPLEKIVAR